MPIIYLTKEEFEEMRKRLKIPPTTCIISRPEGATENNVYQVKE